LRPAATGWLRERVNGVTYTVGETVESIHERRGRLELRLSNGGRRHVDHLVLGTGYAPRLARNRILAPGLIAQVHVHRGQARLTRHFETSVPGLYVVGPAADQSFGPLMDSVDGTRCAGQRVARHVSHSARRSAFAAIRIPAASIGAAAISPALGFKSFAEQ
jgi:pyruvate/2-oxoglutarate dehydrogenase complex dihydrolipoamide dehydrogenase (E3) component